jgi:hypothetical protein
VWPRRNGSLLCPPFQPCHSAFGQDRSIGGMSEFERLSESRASHTRSDLTPNLGAAAVGGKRSFDHLVGNAKD